MDHKAKPYSLGRTIAVGLGVATGFALLSFFFFVLQAKNSQDHIAGMVVAVAPDSVDIRNARGAETMVIVTPDVDLRGVASLDGLAPGQHVMARGQFDEAGVFVAIGLRLIRAPKPE